MEEEPGTYYLTDYLVRSFHRSVIVELGLDRYPELRPDYFAHYRRVLWLAQQPTDELRALAMQGAEAIGLPLEIEVVGTIGLERQLALLLRATSAATPPMLNHISQCTQAVPRRHTLHDTRNSSY